MYCPQCGQQQISETVRFCSRCGFLLEGVSVVLGNGGQVPARYVPPVPLPPSPRSRGVRQGAMLMLSTLLVVPVVAILSVNFFVDVSEILVPLAALFSFVGGLLRILYALLMEDPVAQPVVDPASGYASFVAPQFERPANNAALPPASAGAAAWPRSRPNTAEIYQPPSVTEKTTRLLGKDEPNTR